MEGKVRPLAAWILLGLLGASLAPPGAALAADVWIELWLHETSRTLESVAVGDVDGDGRPELVALNSQGVTLYALEEDGPRFLAGLPPVPEQPSAVAVHRRSQDQEAAVWVGTRSPGITYVFRFDAATRSLERIERIAFAWGDIQRLVPLDFDGEGGTDLAVLTAQRELVLFRWTPAGYVRLDLGGLEKDVRHVEAADLDGDGRDELVAARGENHVVVLEWQPAGTGSEADGGGRLVRAWENYVWGAHVALMVDAFRAGAPEIVVPSSQRVAHHFAYVDDGGLRAVGTPVEWHSLGGRLIGTGDFDGDGRAEAAEVTPAGLAAWSIGSRISRTLEIELSRPGVFFAHPDPGSGRLIVAGPWGFALLARQEAHYVRVIHRGAPVALIQPARLIDGVPYLSAEDWEALLGLRLHYHAASNTISGFRGFHFLLGRPGAQEWLYDGRTVVAESRPFVEDGVLYIGADVARIAGADTFWEPFSRTLVVYP